MSADGEADPREPDEAGEQTLDPRIFIKQLAPDQLGLFEPLSGLILLNMSKAELRDVLGRWVERNPTNADRSILRTILHEAYHFAQAAASGYVFHQQARLLMVFNASLAVPEPELRPDLQALLDAAREQAGDDPELLGRCQQMEAVLRGELELDRTRQLVPKGDHSVMGAHLPEFFAHMKELIEGERVANAERLSILGVIEGSAVVHAQLLMHPDEDATPQLEAELATLPPLYRELYDLTVARVGDRALELLLPATALALRFMRPHDAYLPVLARLAESPRSEAVEYGRGLLERLHTITAGGHLLGAAIDVRRMDDGYRSYDSILDSLESGEWGVNSYEFLAQPSATYAVGFCPFGIVTTDGYYGSLDPSDAAARMVLMGAVLRTLSRRRAEHEFWQFEADWGRSVISRLITE